MDYEKYIIEDKIPDMDSHPLLSWNPDPLYSEILPNLFQGGTARDDTIFSKQDRNARREDLPFDSVISMYYASSPAGWGVQEMRFPIKDGLISEINLEELKEVISWGYNQVVKGNKILVRCQAGLNRSGLVTALILIQLGYEPGDAIDLIRKNRGSIALYNTEYVLWLLKEGKNFTSSVL